MTKKYIDKSRNKIKVLDWKKYRPEGFNSVSDSYYVKLSSRIYKELLAFSPDTAVWTKECVREISIVSSSYLEDVVSNLGIFKSFRDKHEELYGSKLPFFKTGKDYFEDAVNYVDVLFLVWYISSLHIFTDGFLFPFGGTVIDLADIIYDILEDEYDDAPINKTYSEIFEALETDDPAIMRLACFEIARSNYLYGPDIISRFKDYLDEHMEIAEDDIEAASNYAYLFQVLFSFKVRSCLLSMDIFEIAGRLAKHHGNDDIEVFSVEPESFIFSLFEILYIGDEYIEARHFSSGAVIRIVKETFRGAESLKPNLKLLLGVVKKSENWYFCGVSISGASYDGFSYKRYEAHIFNDHMRQSTEESLQKLTDFFIERYKGKMLFLSPEEAQKIPEDFFKAYNKKNSLEKNLDYDEDASDLNDGIEELKFPGTENITVYFNSKSGFEFYNGVAECIDVKGNPFFKELDKYCVMHLICSNRYSTEFYNEIIDLFFVKKALKKIKDYNEFSRKEFDFFKRFYSSDKYKTKPTLALVNVVG